MRRFPWHTLAHLLLTTWALGLIASLWVQALVNTLAAKLMLTELAGWRFTFATYFPGEPWVDGVLILTGGSYLAWRWSSLLRALWEKWR